MAEETKTNVTETNEGANPPAEATPAQGQPQTFDDVLKNKEHQSEFDRRVTKAIETARAKWDGEFEEKLNAKIAEANKLAKMTADEKAKFERDKQEADYNKRLAEVTKRELKAEAKEQFASDGLPTELADVLVYTDAEACKASMDAVKTAFNAAVEKAVNDRLRGNTPKTGAQLPDADKMSDEEYYSAKLKK